MTLCAHRSSPSKAAASAHSQKQNKRAWTRYMKSHPLLLDTFHRRWSSRDASVKLPICSLTRCSSSD